ncbi:MAG TPA: vWA domain-containing protein [Mycobacteriales bacterium]|jgi:hypothetical protein|nr:vWA domain-containing protein [Mycobacteriales bacterium]
MPSVRPLRPVLALAVALATATPFVGARAVAPVGDDIRSCRTKGQVTIRKDGWAQIKPPTYDDGSVGPISVLAASERALGVVFATNGKQVSVSPDGGCIWNHVFQSQRDVGQVGGVGSPQEANEVFNGLVTPGLTSLWVTSYDGSNGAFHPHVYYSSDASLDKGTSPKKPFESVDVGLPAAGKPLQLVAANDSHRNAYLLVEEPPDATTGDVATPVRRLYRTTSDENLSQAGVSLSWERVALPAGLEHVEGIALDPSNSGGVWVWGGSQYAASGDGGTKWTDLFTAQGGVVASIQVAMNGDAQLFLNTPQGSVHQIVDTPGHVVRSVSLPATVAVATRGMRAGVVAFSDPAGKTFGYDVDRRKWVPLGPVGGPPFQRLFLVNVTAGRALLAQTPNGIFRTDLYDNETFLPPAHPPEGTGDPNVVPDIPHSPYVNAVLKTPVPEVTLQPGREGKVPVELIVPPKTTPLNVYFLMDTTTSMGSSIRSLKKNLKRIAHRVREATGKSACFGVGEFKDLTAVGVGSTASPEPNSVYRKRQEIDCNDYDLSKVSAGIDKLHESGGGDEPEAHTVALIGSVDPTNNLVKPFGVGADQGAGFGDAYRLIVMISDARFHREAPHPPVADAISVLNANYTQVVGVTVRNAFNDTAAAYSDMQEVAAGTNTFAPSAGVDCDGDGKRDLGANEPLVCLIDGSAEETNLTPAIVSLLLSVPDPGALAVKAYDSHKIVKKIIGENHIIKNLKLENHLPLTLDVACGKADDGLDVKIPLVGTVRGVPVAKNSVTVHCRSIPLLPPPPPPKPEPPVEFIPPPPQILPVPAAVPLPVVPPAPVPAPNGPNPPGNANAGFSSEEEKQFQLAPAAQGGEEQAGSEVEEEESDLAMSGLDRDDPAAMLVLGCGMLMSSVAAGGYAYRRRVQRSLRGAYVSR